MVVLMDCVDELPLCCKIEHERKSDEHVMHDVFSSERARVVVSAPGMVRSDYR